MGNVGILAFSLWTSVSMTTITPVENHTVKPSLPITLQQILHEEHPSETEKNQTVTPIPNAYEIPQATFVSQSYNNCGPAALSMVLSIYGKPVSQEELASKMRPFNNSYGGVDDKSTFPDEFVKEAKNQGFEGLYRPNGNLTLLKQLIANDIPVVVRTWLNPGEDIGHFRIIRGYNDAEQVFTQDDSYQGSTIRYTYDEVLSMWEPFNYSYMLVYPKEKQPIVDAILGEDRDETTAWENALKRAKTEAKINPDDPYPGLNRAIAYYYLGDYKQSVASYDAVKDTLPNRILWYMIEPVFAYQKVGNYDRIFEISDGIFNNGNPAYSELYYIRGEIYREEGKKDLAKNEFEKAVYYNSNYIPAKQALEKI